MFFLILILDTQGSKTKRAGQGLLSIAQFLDVQCQGSWQAASVDLRLLGRPAMDRPRCSGQRRREIVLRSQAYE